MMTDQFAPYEPEYLKQWRKRLDDAKPAKHKRRPKVEVYVAGNKTHRLGKRKVQK